MAFDDVIRELQAWHEVRGKLNGKPGRKPLNMDTLAEAIEAFKILQQLAHHVEARLVDDEWYLPFYHAEGTEQLMAPEIWKARRKAAARDQIDLADRITCQSQKIKGDKDLIELLDKRIERLQKRTQELQELLKMEGLDGEHTT
ncbi:MAG: hypothetical protein GY906_07795 [bacterium]|nr:hypothetical protein [bacterium]